MIKKIMPFEKEFPAFRVIARKSDRESPAFLLPMMEKAEGTACGREGLGIVKVIANLLSWLTYEGV